MYNRVCNQKVPKFIHFAFSEFKTEMAHEIDDDLRKEHLDSAFFFQLFCHLLHFT